MELDRLSKLAAADPARHRARGHRRPSRTAPARRSASPRSARSSASTSSSPARSARWATTTCSTSRRSRSRAPSRSQRIQSDPLRGSPDELIEGVRVAAYRLLAPDQLHGSIQVQTDLVGAEVRLDGKLLGKTPLANLGVIAKQPLGKHKLRVQAPGYDPFEDEVDVHFQKVSPGRRPPAARRRACSAPARSSASSATPIYTRTWFIGRGRGRRDRARRGDRLRRSARSTCVLRLGPLDGDRLPVTPRLLLVAMMVASASASAHAERVVAITPLSTLGTEDTSASTKKLTGQLEAAIAALARHQGRLRDRRSTAGDRQARRSPQLKRLRGRPGVPGRGRQARRRAPS